MTAAAGARHPCHLADHRAGFSHGITSVTTESDPVGVDFDIVKLRAGEKFEDVHSDKESAWTLFSGRVRVTIDGAQQSHALSRASLFDERPSVVHVPAGVSVHMIAESDVEWSRARATNPKKFAPTVFMPEATKSERRGEGLAQDASLRIVRLVFDFENRPESQLVVGEVVHMAGRWSSYPPHHHAQPELYHYRFTEPQGYGHAELGDDVVKVKQFDTVKILDGVDHPQVAAPGYGMYYLWIVRHREHAPYRGFEFTPEHRWILEGKEQGWRPKELR